ncbi:MAG: hypothetical protein HWD92_03165 [Flavobacteriia bacterium]|nr:hypothetical protein [Flavobacteriia bacterium]
MKNFALKILVTILMLFDVHAYASSNTTEASIISTDKFSSVPVSYNPLQRGFFIELEKCSDHYFLRLDDINGQTDYKIAFLQDSLVVVDQSGTYSLPIPNHKDVRLSIYKDGVITFTAGEIEFHRATIQLVKPLFPYILSSQEEQEVKFNSMLVFAPPSTSLTNTDFNRVTNRRYSYTGQLISEQTTYSDGMNRVVQNNFRNVQDNTVISNQAAFDARGLAAIETLDAQSQSQTLDFNNDFFTAGSNPYDYNDFDLTGTGTGSRLNPAPVALGSDIGTYFSDLGSESHVGTTSYPYQRKFFSNDPFQRLTGITTEGDERRAGSGRELWMFYMKNIGELSNMYGRGGSFLYRDGNPLSSNQIQKIQKNIAIGPDGETMIEYVNLQGLPIARAFSGIPNSCADQIAQTEIIQGRGAVSVHVPLANIGDMKLYIPLNVGSAMTYVIEDLETEEALVSGVDYTLTNPSSGWHDVSFTDNTRQRFLRISVTIDPTFIIADANVFFERAYPGAVRVKTDYSHWEIYNYNENGDQVRHITPEGIDCGYDASSYTKEMEWWYALIGTGATGTSHVMRTYNYTPISGNANHVNLQITTFSLSDGVNTGPTEGYDMGSGKIFISEDVQNSVINELSEALARDNVNNASQLELSNVTKLGSEDVVELSNSTSFKGPIASGPSPDDPDYNWYSTKWRYEADVELFAVDPGVGQSSLGTRTLVYEFVFLLAIQVDGAISEDYAPTFMGYYSFPQEEVLWDVDGQTITNHSQLELELVSARYGTITSNFYDIDGVVTSFTSLSNLIYSLKSDFTFESTPIFQNHGSDFAEITDYDDMGRLTAVSTPNEGDNTYLYQTNTSRIKFAQGSDQVSTGKFSYIEYDHLGRIVETGVYDPIKQGTGSAYVYESYEQIESQGYISPNSTHTLLNSTGFLDQDRKVEVIQYYYDLPTNDIPAGYNSTYIQENCEGALAKSENDNTITWYSYDENSLLSWMLVYDKNEELPVQTIDYVYDENLHLVSKIHNKTVQEAFTHDFKYDLNTRLVQSSVSYLPDGDVPVRQASYEFYPTGELKRTSHGVNTQGVDYVYTVDGLLKSINEFTLSSRDPGLDGFTGDHDFFYDDYFGQTYSYYTNDYKRSGTNIQTYIENGNDRYDGSIATIFWNNQATVSAYSNQMIGFTYTYDALKRLAGADFGIVDFEGSLNGTGPGAAPSFSSTNDYNVHQISYDKNGNLNTLSRDGYQSANIDVLNYGYQAGTDKLTELTDQNFIQNLADELYGSMEFVYDERGRVTQLLHIDAGLDYTVTYTSRGRLESVFDVNRGQYLLRFFYDDRQNKWKEESYGAEGLENSKFYFYDVEGKLIATFNQNHAAEERSPTLSEHAIYGLGRLGFWDHTTENIKSKVELKDHQGNVRMVLAQQLNLIDHVSSYSDLGPWLPRGSTHLSPDGNAIVVSGNAGDGIRAVINGATPGKRYLLSLDADLQYTSGSPTLVRVSVIDINSGNNNIFLHDFKPGEPIQAGFTALSDKYVIHVFVAQTSQSGDWSLSDIVINSDEGLEILNADDYYPFGWQLPERSFVGSTGDHEYKGQGEYAEKLEELNWLSFALRAQDPRIGRWLSPDPAHQFHSPYTSMGNSPINIKDPDGAWGYENQYGEKVWFNDVVGIYSFTMDGLEWTLISIDWAEFLEGYTTIDAFFEGQVYYQHVRGETKGHSAQYRMHSADAEMTNVVYSDDPSVSLQMEFVQLTLDEWVRKKGGYVHYKYNVETGRLLHETLGAVNINGEDEDWLWDYLKGWSRADVGAFNKGIKDINSHFGFIENLRTGWYDERNHSSRNDILKRIIKPWNRQLSRIGNRYPNSRLVNKTLRVNSAARSRVVSTRTGFARGLRNVGRASSVLSGATLAIDIGTSQQFRSSHFLDIVVTGVSCVPGWGWAFGALYYVADQTTRAITNKSIGEHLDDATNGGVWVDWGDD